MQAHMIFLTATIKMCSITLSISECSEFSFMYDIFKAQKLENSPGMFFNQELHSSF